MEFRNLGNSGLKVSVLSLGTGRSLWGEKLKKDKAEQILDCALKLGVNTIDLAENYGDGKAESMVGSFLKKKRVPRDEFVIASKAYFKKNAPNKIGLSRKRVREACDSSLKRLRLEYIDLYYCHVFDENTPLIETVEAMSRLVDQGKILYWGTSNWTPEQVEEAVALAEKNNLVKPSMEQCRYNIFDFRFAEENLKATLQKFGLGLLTYCPLDEGILSGKYNKGLPRGSRLALSRFKDIYQKLSESEQGRVKIKCVQQIQSLASELGMSSSNLSMAYCLKNNMVSSVITGVSSVSQLKENLKSIQSVELITSDVEAELKNIVKPLS